MSATQSFHHDYPYRLRIQHPEYAEIRIERKGRFLRIDPADAPENDEIVVLTSPAPHRARATVEALREGRHLTVIAVPAVLDWLARAGAVDGHAFPHVVDGVSIDAMAYTAPTQARPLSHFFRASVIGARPDSLARRFWFTADSSALSTARRVAGTVTLARCTVAGSCLGHTPRVVVGGNGVSGPTFVDNAAYREWVWKTFTADALDMETAAVALVAYQNQVPFIAFRSLSDLAGGGAGQNEVQTFGRLAADNSAAIVLAYLKALR